MSTGGYIQPYPNELGSYVHKGVWERYDEPPYQRLKWTLNNFSALLVVACLTALLAFTQSECWHLLRYVIAQFTRPVRLPGSKSPDRLLELSQGEAVESILPLLTQWVRQIYHSVWRRSPESTEANYPVEFVESPWFGIASLTNIAFFLVMGVAIPWLLTEGAFGTPIVKSKPTDYCWNSTFNLHILNILNRQTRSDDIFRLCRDKLNSGCDDPYHLTKPHLTKTMLTTCPFGGNICLNDSIFEMTHWNMSPFEMGLNSRSQLTMNHRLTCSPVSLDQFLWPQQSGSFIWIPKNGPQKGDHLWPNISLILKTWNGPNKFSNESSGLQASKAQGPFDLTVLPGYTAGTDWWVQGRLELNELLERSDGQSFLTVFRAGNTRYSIPVDDPLFSAHIRQIPEPAPLPSFPNISVRPMYFPDHEATALGCVEQFQYCFPPSGLPHPCTDWGPRNEQFSAMATFLSLHLPGFMDDPIAALEHGDDQFAWSLNEMYTFFKITTDKFAIYDYLASRIYYQKGVPLIRQKDIVLENRALDHYEKQWMIEVETWFMKAYLTGILSIQDAALFSILDLDSRFSVEYGQKWKLCSRILFHNNNFTNINWIGFWVTTASLTFLCLVGHQVARLHDVLKFMSRWLAFGFTKLFLNKFAGWIRTVRRPMVWFGRPAEVMYVFELLQLVSRKRPWYENRSSGGASASAQMNDSGRSSTCREAGDDADEYYSIDDPI